jgi:anthranilate/para-aminobenzoate synthase component II
MHSPASFSQNPARSHLNSSRCLAPPCSPGICLDIFRHLHDVPVLGVCLGHQALAAAHGARTVKAPEPVHGRLSELQHTGHPLLQGIPSGPGQGFEVVRWGMHLRYRQAGFRLAITWTPLNGSEEETGSVSAGTTPLLSTPARFHKAWR